MKRTPIFLATQLALLAMANPGFAQTASPAEVTASTANSAEQGAPAAEKGRPQELQTIVITGTKRRQNVQKVAASVGTVSGEELAERNIYSVAGLAAATPSISFTDSGTGRNSALAIRGVGTLTFSDSIEGSVGLVTDGVVLGRTAMGLSGLYDVERVEVLRGPQGTLFGKNSTAGVINVVTRDPGMKKFDGDVDLNVGSYGLVRATGGISVPLQENVAALRLAFLGSHRDGYIENVADGTKVGDLSEKGVRLKALLTPVAGRRIALGADYMEIHGQNNAPTGVLPQVSARDPRGIGNSLADILGAENAKINSSDVPDNTARFSGASLQWDESLGAGYNMTSITGYRTGKTDEGVAGIVPNSPVKVNNTRVDLSQFSQELRLASPAGGNFDYVAGLYFYKQTTESLTNQIADFWAFSSAVPARGVILARNLFDSNTETNSYAAFGQANFRATDQLSFLGGARYTHETVDMTMVSGPLGTYQAINGATLSYRSFSIPVGSLADSLTTNKPSWQLGARYEHTKQSMSYATLSQGFKGAGFNSVTATGTAEAVKPETATSLEVGFKSRFLSNRMKTNVSLFVTDYKDFQAQATTIVNNAPIFKLINAGKLRSQGVELDVEALLADSLKVGFNGAYVDAKFKDFPNGPCTNQQQLAGCKSQDLAGGVLPGSPKLSFNLSLKKDIYLESMPFDASARLDYSWRDKVQWSASQDPETISPSIGLLGLSGSLNDRFDKWTLTFYGKNLTNKFSSRLRATTLPGVRVEQFISPEYQRTFGANLAYRF